MLHCSKIYLLRLNVCLMLTYYAQIMPDYLCLSSHALLIISSLWINYKWLKHKLTCRNAYHRKDRYTLIEQSAMCDCSIRVTDCSIRVYQSFCNSYFYKQEFILLQNILLIMLALCSMLSGTYYAHNYASIIGGSLLTVFTQQSKFLK